MKKNDFIAKFQILFVSFLLFSLGATAQVGIGTTTPATTLDVNGALSLRDGGTLTLSNGNNNNITLPTTAGRVYSNYRIIGPTSTFRVRSIVPVAGVDGQVVILQNTTTQTMIISHDISGAANNRIYVPSEQDLSLTGRYSSVTLIYSNAQNRWIVQNKLSDETIWYYPPIDIDANTTYTITAGIPNCNRFSSVSVNLSGDWPTSPADDVTIHHVEARSGAVRFIVTNNTGAWGGGTNFIGMDFIISVRN
ncbi:hypothetical protein OS188_06880 [Xanthomarina sp. F1114]|uniref:hypothetical protein n=1 Tax=Xanthomarina sp. F1114 TaxID=2996019 RepID=UPI00225DDB73|nr:hypothetical protein [Xanthomarina sp. F1114]MCX7547671.1 hypothetical protein [Xanthomarina sp. F1114]